MTEKACTKCKLIVEGSECPQCGPDAKLTSRWSGYIIITNPEESEIAKKLGITMPGKYAQRMKK